MSDSADAPLAHHKDDAVQFSDVLLEELKQIQELRRKRGVDHPSAGLTSSKPETVFGYAHESKLTGLAFSGGGIRSATFNLGVLQGLAKYGRLRMFDYLSTVSGGGYIGSWLETWILREGKKARVAHERTPGQKECSTDPEHAGIRVVEANLHPERTKREEAVKGAAQKAVEEKQTEPKPIRFLREYSNYLTPRMGILGADTWTMVAIYLRNLLLNQAILTLFLFSLLLLPYIAVWLTKSITAWHCAGTTWLAPVAVFLLTVLALSLATGNLDRLGDCDEGQWRKRLGCFQSQGVIVTAIALPHFLAAWILTGWIWCHPEFWKDGRYLGWWIIGGIIGLGVPWCIACSFAPKQPTKNPCDRELKHPLVYWRFYSLFMGAVGGLMCYVVAHKIFAWLQRPLPDAQAMDGRVWHEVSLGVPLVLVVYMLSAALQMGLMGRSFVDPYREWWSRLAGWLFILTIMWAVGFGLAAYAPLGVIWLRNWVKTAGIAWLGTTAAGVLGGKSSKTGGDAALNWKDKFLSVTPYVFIAGFASLLALFLELIMVQVNWSEALAGQWSAFLCENPVVQKVVNWVLTVSGSLTTLTLESKETAARAASAHSVPAYITAHWQLLDATLNYHLVFYCLGAFLLCLALSYRVDLNEFSMNLFYRNRLVRCYLGATHEHRSPNPFSGFDPCDDLFLTDLLPDKCYSGPFPIFNATLNLVSGRDLAWQERKAESFTMTPLRCGYDTWLERVNLYDEFEQGTLGAGMPMFAYRPTTSYLYPNGGPFVGTTVSISGAALSPNMGYHSVPSLAMLMTFFNVRLGFWAGNPRHHDTWRDPGPKVGLFRLLGELFALTDDDSKYVYLSDGGHFENLGVYELVKRRCKYIIACDAGADPDYTLEDLGNAIRKCREDIGVEIVLNTKPVVLITGSDGTSGDGADKAGGQPQGNPQAKGRKWTKWHCAVGEIRYDMIDPPVLVKPGEEKRKDEKDEEEKRRKDLNGVFVYLKASLTGDEPADVLNYQTSHKNFPHESTADQWFSESQFESYRRLGQHVVETIFEPLIEEAKLNIKTPTREAALGAVRSMETGELFERLENKWGQKCERTEAKPNHGIWEEIWNKIPQPMKEILKAAARFVLGRGEKEQG